MKNDVCKRLLDPPFTAVLFSYFPRHHHRVFHSRLAPTNPVERTIAELRSRGTYLDPAHIQQMVDELTGDVWLVWIVAGAV